jgi:hypothetical protein
MTITPDLDFILMFRLRYVSRALIPAMLAAAPRRCMTMTRDGRRAVEERREQLRCHGYCPLSGGAQWPRLREVLLHGTHPAGCQGSGPVSGPAERARPNGVELRGPGRAWGSCSPVTMAGGVTHQPEVPCVTDPLSGVVPEKIETKAGWTFPQPDEDRSNGYPDEIQDFMESIANGREPPSSGRLA